MKRRTNRHQLALTLAILISIENCEIMMLFKVTNDCQVGKGYNDQWKEKGEYKVENNDKAQLIRTEVKAVATLLVEVTVENEVLHLSVRNRYVGVDGAQEPAANEKP